MSDEEDPRGGWRPLDFSAMSRRLQEVKNLLRQAAAVGLAQDVARLEALADISRRGGEHGDAQRRRYR
jgi:hypothetical protein